MKPLPSIAEVEREDELELELLLEPEPEAERDLEVDRESGVVSKIEGASGWREDDEAAPHHRDTFFSVGVGLPLVELIELPGSSSHQRQPSPRLRAFLRRCGALLRGGLRASARWLSAHGFEVAFAVALSLVLALALALALAIALAIVVGLVIVAGFGLGFALGLTLGGKGRAMPVRPEPLPESKAHGLLSSRIAPPARQPADSLP